MITVFSQAHFGPVAIEVQNVDAAVECAEELQRRGDTDVRVGSSLEHSIPIEVWAYAQARKLRRPRER